MVFQQRYNKHLIRVKGVKLITEKKYMVKKDMMITKLKKGILSFFIISIFMGITISSASGVGDDVSISPIGISRPDGPMMQILHNGFLKMIRDMDSANFTPDNVYYGVYDNVGSYKYPIAGNNERNITVNLGLLKLLLNKSIDHLQDISANSTDLAYLNSVYAELELHSQISLYNRVEANLNVNSSQDRKAVTILYDKDRSVIEAFDTIKENGTITTQPFTGDEVFTNILMSLVKDEITGTYEEWNQWKYEDGTNATQLLNFVKRLSRNRWMVNALNLIYRNQAMNIMRTMLGPDHIYEDSARSIERGRFSVSQLKINKLNLRKIGEKLIISDFDYVYLEHHLLGNLVYNDTNNNGYMDIGVKSATIGSYDIAYPAVGDEAMFRFDMEDIETRSYQRPQTNSELLEFGSTFTNVEGYLNPIEKNEDNALFNVSTDSVHTIDEVSTLFHFGVNNTDGSVNLKFDYVLGTWDKPDELEGLSFSQLLASTVVASNVSRKIQWRHENGTDLNNSPENSSKMGRFRIGESEDQIGEVSLDEIPYLWNNTEDVFAIGQLIPLNLIDVTYGKISSEGDMIRSLARNTKGKTYLYSISYPKWSGESIVHDPTYSVMSGTGGDTSSTQSGVIPGFEFGITILAIPLICLIGIFRRKRK